MAKYGTNDEAFESGFREAMKDWTSMSIDDMKRIGSTQSQKLQGDDAHSWNPGYRAGIDWIDGWVSRGVQRAEELGLTREFADYPERNAFRGKGGKRRHAGRLPPCDKCGKPNQIHEWSNYCSACREGYQARVARDPETAPVGSRLNRERYRAAGGKKRHASGQTGVGRLAADVDKMLKG